MSRRASLLLLEQGDGEVPTVEIHELLTLLALACLTAGGGLLDHCHGVLKVVEGRSHFPLVKAMGSKGEADFSLHQRLTGP
jgi:hypothetical protein